MQNNPIIYNNKLFSSLIFIVSICFLFSEDDNQVNGKEQEEVIEILPEVNLKDLNNKKINIYSLLKSGPILINFWFLACEPCKKEMKYLDEYNQKYAQYNFQVISVNIDQGRNLSKVKSYVAAKEYSFPVLSDPRMLLFRKVGGKIMPFLLLIDQEGNIIKSHIGYNPGDEIALEQEIQEIIQYEKIDSLQTQEPSLEN